MERPAHSPSKSPLDDRDLEIYVLKVEDVLTMIHHAMVQGALKRLAMTRPQK